MADVVFVSRSIGAATGGGIGSHLLAKLPLLARQGQVTVITTEANESLLEELFHDAPTIRIAAIAEPASGEVTEDGFYDSQHRWSALVYARLSELYSERAGPDYIEFSDYLAEGTVTIQARRTADPMLERTTVAINIATTTEICDVLNGYWPDDLETATLYNLERYCLAYADVLINAPGDIYTAYQRFYGADQLAPSAIIGHVCPAQPLAQQPSTPAAIGDLRILYFGRLERRKGVHALVDALANSPLQGWRLTLVGADTPTAALKTSMRSMLEQAAGRDPRIEIRDAVPQSEIPDLIRDHDVMITPSKWECGPNSALEALACNRPLLATPVGGQLEMAIEGQTGMQASGTGAAELYELVARAVAGRDELRAMVADEKPVGHYRKIADLDNSLKSYQELFSRTKLISPSSAEAPLVSIVIPYYKMSEYIERTARAACEQTYANVEIVIVNDGSFDPEDAILDRIAAEYPLRVLNTPNRGLSAARNFGIRQTSGEFVVPLDSDNTLHPTFVERCLRVLQSDAQIAYSSSWFRCVGPDDKPVVDPSTSHPISNFGAIEDRNNLAGDAIGVFRRSIFEEGLWYHELLLGFEDWSLFRNMRDRGLIGHVVPEYLFNYRIRSSSKLRAVALPNAEQLYAELAASDRSRKMQWMPI